MPDEQPITRLCPRCGMSRVLSRFALGMNVCKDCTNITTRLRRANRHLPTHNELKRLRTEKTCSKCGITKAAAEFPKRLMSCRICENARKLAWANTRIERVREQKLAHWRRNKEKYEEYRQRNIERVRERVRRHHKKYYRENRDKNFEDSRNRRARIKNAPGKHSKEDVRALLEVQKGQCATCKSDIRSGFHVDHVMPLSRGGSNWPDNLQLLCQHCNMRKGRKDPYRWAQENGRLF